MIHPESLFMFCLGAPGSIAVSSYVVGDAVAFAFSPRTEIAGVRARLWAGLWRRRAPRRCNEAMVEIHRTRWLRCQLPEGMWTIPPRVIAWHMAGGFCPGEPSGIGHHGRAAACWGLCGC